jgi:hypothetical protein
MGFKVVHFSRTRLAGAPVRLVQALQRHTDCSARLVDLVRWGTFDHDVVFAEDPDVAVELAEKADIIHLHNHLDLNSCDFSPIDFLSLKKRGKFFVRHFHSTPMLVAQVMGISVPEVLNDSIPSIVIAQYPERFYPRARVVPNIIPQDCPDYLPTPMPDTFSIVFSPTWGGSAWSSRWDTKGAPEVLRLLRQVGRRTGCVFRYVTGQPLKRVMEEKRNSSVVIDDLITGSYHLSGLEGLCLGRPVLGYLDARVQAVLQEISGSRSCPFVNVRLEDALEVLTHLSEHPADAAETGRAGRQWVENHWTDRVLVGHFVDVYEKLMSDPATVTRQESLRLDGGSSRFHATVLPDLVYASRARSYKASLSLPARARQTVTEAWTALRGRTARFLGSARLSAMRRVMKPLLGRKRGGR